jgi:hypothetical protein
VVLFVISGVFGITILGVIIFLFFFLLRVLDVNLSSDLRFVFFIILAILFLLALLVVFVFSAFYATLYGLSYDIMSSGDLYTEFKHSFSYFKRNWFAYVIISLPIFSTSFFYQVISKDRLLLYILFIIFDYLSIMYLTGLLTSVTAKGKFLFSFKESFNLLRKDFKRIALTIGIYFLIFRSPYIIAVYVAKLGLILDSTVIMLLGINFVLMVFSSFLGNPILSILATRIYNTN